MRFSIGGCVANRPAIDLLRRGDEERAQLVGDAQVLLGQAVHARGDLAQRRGQRARAAGDERGAAVGDELAVARQGHHEEERDDVDDERDEDDDEDAGAVVVVAVPPPPKRKPNCRIIAATEAKNEAIVMIITSRFLTCASSCAMTPSSSAGESRFMIPVVAQTVALFCERAEREGVGHVRLGDGDLRLGQVGLDAEALDHRVQLGRLLRRDLARAHRVQRELVGGEELQQPRGRRR